MEKKVLELTRAEIWFFSHKNLGCCLIGHLYICKVVLAVCHRGFNLNPWGWSHFITWYFILGASSMFWRRAVRRTGWLNHNLGHHHQWSLSVREGERCEETKVWGEAGHQPGERRLVQRPTIRSWGTQDTMWRIDDSQFEGLVLPPHLPLCLRILTVRSYGK